MPRLSDTTVPSYREHKQSGQAIVTLSSRDFLLGSYGSKESKAEYRRRIAEWLAAGRQLIVNPVTITIVEVVAAFRRHAQKYYAGPDGVTGKALTNIEESLRPVVKLYGRTPAADFGPLKLKAVRETMITDERVRTNINRHIGRIKSVFRWAAENEMIPGSVYHGLLAVGGLRIGKCEAVESDPVKPVAVAHVEAILHHISPQVSAMVRLQLVTGMRSGEVVIMRGCDIDTTGKLWQYKPAKHKTMNHGHERIVYLGPKAQEIIRPFLKTDLQACLFSPADAEAHRRQLLHEHRKTPLSCGNRPGTNKRRRAAREPGNAYTPMTYYRAIMRGCEAAFPTPDGMADAAEVKRWKKAHHFFPHQVRHTTATELRKTHGLEGAQVVLGHHSLSATQLYAEKNKEKAREIMAQVG